MDQKQKDGKRFITPSGAGLAAICFFMPWMRACGQDVSGFQIANGGESALWLVLIAAIAIVVGFFIYDGQNKLKDLKPIVIVGAGVSLLILLFKYSEFNKQGGGMFEMKFGSVGTILGFGASLFGLLFLEDTVTTTAVQPTYVVGNKQEEKEGIQTEINYLAQESTGKFCGNCGTKGATEALFCANCGEKL